MSPPRVRIEPPAGLQEAAKPMYSAMKTYNASNKGPADVAALHTQLDHVVATEGVPPMPRQYVPPPEEHKNVLEAPHRPSPAPVRPQSGPSPGRGIP